MNWSDIPGDDPSNAAMIKRDERPAVPQEDPLCAALAAIDKIMLPMWSALSTHAKATGKSSPAAGLTIEHLPGTRWTQPL